MNYLNEAASSFPSAISFCAGRPADEFFTVSDALDNIPCFLEYYAEECGITWHDAKVRISQYGPSRGIINQFVSRQVASDERIICAPENLIITCGAQEAMFLCLAELCNRAGDVVLVRNPTYIGINGAAELQGIETYGLSVNHESELPSAIECATKELRKARKRARALYLIPNFDNPTGQTLSLVERKSILAACQANEITIIEDNPYGLFRFEGAHIPSLYSLDNSGSVVYLGTYSKTLCPALRVGFALLPSNQNREQSLRLSLERRKSFVSLNTSQIMQIAVGGTLIADQFSLVRRTTHPCQHYKRNRNLLLARLKNMISKYDLPAAVRSAEGGFFLTLELPGRFGVDEMLACVREAGVLVMPVSFFSNDRSYDRIVRFAYSNLNSADIERGIDRFERFFRANYATR